ncbi:unnamed protein product [Arctogadus glacialis]
MHPEAEGGPCLLDGAVGSVRRRLAPPPERRPAPADNSSRYLRSRDAEAISAAATHQPTPPAGAGTTPTLMSSLCSARLHTESAPLEWPVPPPAEGQTFNLPAT